MKFKYLMNISKLFKKNKENFTIIRIGERVPLNKEAQKIVDDVKKQLYQNKRKWI